MRTITKRSKKLLAILIGAPLLLTAVSAAQTTSNGARFEGRFYAGRGDVEYLQLLDIARRMFSPDPEFQNLSMLYLPAWNGLVEGPTWDAWWVQNSYGPSFCALPFLPEPLTTFLQHSQDLWFDQMGDGRRVGAPPPYDWMAPDGSLCDAARPGWIVFKQGDGKTAIHDWGMEFTAAGLLLQSELLLISRDRQAIDHYLPKLERCAEFIETRRDPTNHLFLAGPAGNLLAPSYAGWRRLDGSYDRAYLTGLSVTYVAALNRLIEVEKLADRQAHAERWARLRDKAQNALALLTTDEGYLIRSLDPDGVRHGVFGNLRHGYFEASPNHDAICFRVADDIQAEKILRKIESIPELRPYQFVLPNYPSYDDMYEKADGLWTFGTWVNGGHWSTCEARMVMAYARLGRYENARASMKKILTFARTFRLDNPLVQFGSQVYQPREPINLTYDAFGPQAALLRGLFEYVYSAVGVTLFPHVPPGIIQLDQLFPVRLGEKRLFLATTGSGAVTGVLVNGAPWKEHNGMSITLPFAALPARARISIALGGAELRDFPARDPELESALPPAAAASSEPPDLAARRQRMDDIRGRLVNAGFSGSYEVAHAQLALDCIRVFQERQARVNARQIEPLTDPSRELAAQLLYLQAATRVSEGLEKVLQSYRTSSDPYQKRVAALVEN